MRLNLINLVFVISFLLFMGCSSSIETTETVLETKNNSNQHPSTQALETGSDETNYSDAQRKTIFKEIQSKESQASKDADLKYPLTDPNIKQEEQSELWMDEESSRLSFYKNEIMKKYSLSEDEYYKISHEGVSRNWYSK